MARLGRPSACGSCGQCARCKRAAYMRQWYRRQTPEKKRAIIDGRDPERVREADRRRAAEHRPGPRAPEKARARWTVKNAIRDGRLQRRPCETCGHEPADAHHDDYSQPLDVRWLCRKHHGEEHRMYPEGEK